MRRRPWCSIASTKPELRGLCNRAITGFFASTAQRRPPWPARDLARAYAERDAVKRLSRSRATSTSAAPRSARRAARLARSAGAERWRRGVHRALLSAASRSTAKDHLVASAWYWDPQRLRPRSAAAVELEHRRLDAAQARSRRPRDLEHWACPPTTPTNTFDAVRDRTERLVSSSSARSRSTVHVRGPADSRPAPARGRWCTR